MLVKQPIYVMEQYNTPLGVKISQEPLSFERNILSVPLYMIDQLERLVRERLRLV